MEQSERDLRRGVRDEWGGCIVETAAVWQLYIVQCEGSKPGPYSNILNDCLTVQFASTHSSQVD